jgi:hypothetical protein
MTGFQLCQNDYHAKHKIRVARRREYKRMQMLQSQIPDNVRVCSGACQKLGTLPILIIFFFLLSIPEV